MIVCVALPDNLPLLAWVCRAVEERPATCAKETVELALVIFQRGSPLATTIHITAFQVVLRAVVQRIEDVVHCFPVYKVLRVHNGCSGREMHGGRNHPIIITYANGIHVGYIRPYNWVREGFLSLHCCCKDEQCNKSQTPDNCFHVLWHSLFLIGNIT